MKLPNLSAILAPLWIPAALLVPLASASGQGGPSVRVESIMDELQGDTNCIARAERYYLTWKAYDKRNQSGGKKGGSIQREAGHATADRGKRVRWTARAPRMSASGRVEGAGNTQYGSSNQDIGVIYDWDWTVYGVYGWGSSRQPRVESVTIIELKPDYAAEFKVTNSIAMTGNAIVTGTAGAANPWEQIAYARGTLSATDIGHGRHERKVGAEATVTRAVSKSESSGTSTTRSFSVTGTANVGAEGVGGSVTGNLSGSKTETHDIEEGESMPTVPSAEDSVEPVYHWQKIFTYVRGCGGTLKFGRTAQISAKIFTSSGDSHGSVTTKGTLIVENGVQIEVRCIPCVGGVPDPEAGRTPVPGSPGSGHSSSGGAQGTGSLPRERYGNVLVGPTTPRSRGGVTYTPSHGGEWWEHPIIKNGGCIYIDPTRLPPVVFPIPVDEAAGFDYSVVPAGQIPLVLPEDSEGADVALGHLVPGTVIQPAEGTTARVVVGANKVVFDGDWTVFDPSTGASSGFDSGFVDYRDGGEVDFAGGHELVAPSGYELLESEEGGLQRFECVDPETGSVAGTALVDPSIPGRVVLDAGFYRTDGELQEMPDVAMGLEQMTTDGVSSSVSFRSDDLDEPVRILSSYDLEHWFPVSIGVPDEGGLVAHDEAQAGLVLPSLGQRYFAAGFEADPNTISFPVPGAASGLVDQLPGLPYLMPHERDEYLLAAQAYFDQLETLRGLQLELQGAEHAERDSRSLVDALQAALADASPSQADDIQTAMDTANASHATNAAAAGALLQQVSVAAAATQVAGDGLDLAADVAADRVTFNRATFPPPPVANPGSRAEVIASFIDFATARGGDAAPGSEVIPALHELTSPAFPGAPDALAPFVLEDQPIDGASQAALSRASMHQAESNAEVCFYGDAGRLFLLNEDSSMSVVGYSTEYGFDVRRY